MKQTHLTKMTKPKPADPQSLEWPEEAVPDGVDDRAWIERIRVGDVDAFEDLYRAFWQPMYAFAFRFMQTRDDAEDVVQEVFFRIWRGRAEWRPAGSIRSYLYLAVRNAARDRIRHAAVAMRWRSGQNHELSDSPSAQQSLEACLESASVAASVERALAELPLRRQAVCRLRLMDGFSYAQIAERLGISPKTVENQLALGLKYLRERMRHRD